MANVYEMPLAEDPPGHGPWAMVVIGAEYSQMQIKHHSLGVTYMGTPDQEEVMMELARAFAEENRANYIFIRRSGDNETGRG